MTTKHLIPTIALLIILTLTLSIATAQVSTDWTISDDFDMGGASSTYTIIYSIGTGGSITPDYPGGIVTVAAGSNITFLISADLHYKLSNVVVDGSSVGVPTNLTFSNIYADHTFEVYFALDVYYITVSTDAGCTATPTGLVSVNSGDDQTISYSASTGYAITGVAVDGSAVALSSPTGSYTFGGVVANHTIAITSTSTATPTPSPSPSPVPSSNIHNHPTTTLNLFMRSDTYNYSDISAYGLDTDYNNTYVSIPVTSTSDNATVTYGFRVYITSAQATYTELTSGIPAAQITVSSNFTGQISSSWTCPDTTVVLGSQVLKVALYAKVDNGSWTLQAIYITNPLMTKELMPATWAFTLQTTMTQLIGNTTSTVTFGDTNHRSTVTGIVIVDPNYTDIQMWQWMRGDIVGLLLGSYLHVLGSTFYILIFLMIFGSLWLRHRSVSPIVFVVTILGGSGGLSIWIFLGAANPLAATIFSVLIILAVMSLIFKVIR
jgi:hypothetical protein